MAGGKFLSFLDSPKFPSAVSRAPSQRPNCLRREDVVEIAISPDVWVAVGHANEAVGVVGVVGVGAGLPGAGVAPSGAPHTAERGSNGLPAAVVPALLCSHGPFADLKRVVDGDIIRHALQSEEEGGGAGSSSADGEAGRAMLPLSP